MGNDLLNRLVIPRGTVPCEEDIPSAGCGVDLASHDPVGMRPNDRHVPRIGVAAATAEARAADGLVDAVAVLETGEVVRGEGPRIGIEVEDTCRPVAHRRTATVQEEHVAAVW